MSRGHKSNLSDQTFPHTFFSSSGYFALAGFLHKFIMHGPVERVLSLKEAFLRVAISPSFFDDQAVLLLLLLLPPFAMQILISGSGFLISPSDLGASSLWGEKPLKRLLSPQLSQLRGFYAFSSFVYRRAYLLYNH